MMVLMAYFPTNQSSGSMAMVKYGISYRIPMNQWIWPFLWWQLWSITVNWPTATLFYFYHCSEGPHHRARVSTMNKLSRLHNHTSKPWASPWVRSDSWLTHACGCLVIKLISNNNSMITVWLHMGLYGFRVDISRWVPTIATARIDSCKRASPQECQSQPAEVISLPGKRPFQQINSCSMAAQRFCHWLMGKPGLETRAVWPSNTGGFPKNWILKIESTATTACFMMNDLGQLLDCRNGLFDPTPLAVPP